MFYLATNPFCPYCYVNDRLLEKDFTHLTDNQITLIPLQLACDLGTFDVSNYYSFYKNLLDTEIFDYFQSYNLTKAKVFNLENIGSSRLVFISYYFLREKQLGLPFYQKISQLFYEDDFDYSDIEQLLKVVKQLGVSTSEYLTALKNPNYEKQYNYYIKLGNNYTINTVPTYVIKEKKYIDIQQAFTFLK